MMDPPDPWIDVWQALRLLAVDPGGLGGVVLRARVGPARAACLAALPDLGLPRRRLHPSVTADELFPAMDFAGTLTSGRPVFRPGLFAVPAEYRLVMAERCPADLAAKLAARIDDSARSCLVALDEGADSDETVPEVLRDRLAFLIDLDGLRAAPVPAFDHEELVEARARRMRVMAAEADIAALTRVAVRLGIFGLRAPILALRAARCNAALCGRDRMSSKDLEVAAATVLAHRATCLPDVETQAEIGDRVSGDLSAPTGETSEEDLLVEAVRVALPDGLLPQSSTRHAGAAGSGAGDKRKARQKGRPIAPRRQRPEGRSRVDLIATLRMAAPWQKLRRIPGRTLTVMPSDICLKRFEAQMERLLIFVVDASGSAAHARLNEAKGAVEHLLARAYAHRDRVALIGFRNRAAEMLLPPNRSLVQAKRRLAALPGGGATPLASGLRCGGMLACKAQKQGMTPTLILLTDGRANVALDGDQDRRKAMRDAETAADWLRASHIRSLVLDTAMRPQKNLCQLANRMGAEHVALPRANPVQMMRTIEAVARH
ncbi:MAG: VWA domain-containing protein [Pseudomonadota bacterium]